MVFEGQTGFLAGHRDAFPKWARPKFFAHLPLILGRRFGIKPLASPGFGGNRRAWRPIRVVRGLAIDDVLMVAVAAGVARPTESSAVVGAPRQPPPTKAGGPGWSSSATRL